MRVLLASRAVVAVIRVNVDSSGAEATGGASFEASISSDGTKVAFHSTATNLVWGDTNGRNDVFVRDLSTNAISVPVTVSGFVLE